MKGKSIYVSLNVLICSAFIVIALFCAVNVELHYYDSCHNYFSVHLTPVRAGPGGSSRDNRDYRERAKSQHFACHANVSCQIYAAPATLCRIYMYALIYMYSFCLKCAASYEYMYIIVYLRLCISISLFI